MRAKDLHMAATIDPISRIIMVSGAIDCNEHAIVLRIPVPESGEWTLIKAETNMTDEVWTLWQITLGEGVNVPTDSSQLLLSRQFKKCKYLPERGAILFYDGEVRPGDAIFKIARLHVERDEIVLSHHRMCDPPKSIEMLEEGFGDEWPKIEVIAPVRIVQPDDLNVDTFYNGVKDAVV